MLLLLIEWMKIIQPTHYTLFWCMFSEIASSKGNKSMCTLTIVSHNNLNLFHHPVT